jgi:transcriptional regulator CtsR
MENEERINEIYERAKRFIKLKKRIDRLIYQLVFIEDSNSSSSEEASKYIQELINLGIITEREVDIIREKVRRWKKYVLDYEGRRFI